MKKFVYVALGIPVACFVCASVLVYAYLGLTLTYGYLAQFMMWLLGIGEPSWFVVIVAGAFAPVIAIYMPLVLINNLIAVFWVEKK